MNLDDSIYGKCEIPDWLEALVKTPIVQRLRWIALSNIPSVTYPMIAGVSRYAHSLGVAHLAMVLSRSLQLPNESHRTLVSAALLHDAGMPPLGHLTEEALSNLNFDYDHEQSLKIVIFDHGQRFEMMPDGEKVGVTEAMEKGHLDSELVFNSIMGQNEHLSRFLVADMDIDNIDNVIRLYRLIYHTGYGYDPENIAVNHFSPRNISSVYRDQWDQVRKDLYTKLMFSIEDFAQKATIKRLIQTYLKKKFTYESPDRVVASIRFLNDYQFLNVILSSLEQSGESCSFFSGNFDRIVCFGWQDSITKEKLRGIKSRIDNINENYYCDFILDKRFKNPNNAGHRGALIGIFKLDSRREKSCDSQLRDVFLSMLPDIHEGMTPATPRINQLQLF